EKLLALFEITRQHSTAVALAVSIRLAQGRPRRARELARLAIQQNPTCPGLYDWAAKAYEACGDERMARAFKGQARLLREHRDAVLSGADLERLDPMEHAYRKLFPGGVDGSAAGTGPAGR
ncbi:MAG: hypothetical protein KKF77_15315, partial [Proteobacteria bacterium]|nr:hypothetical protein [Pseudomonadota bacterium]